MLLIKSLLEPKIYLLPLQQAQPDVLVWCSKSVSCKLATLRLCSRASESEQGIDNPEVIEGRAQVSATKRAIFSCRWRRLH